MIDYLSQRQTGEDELSRMVQGRNPDDELSRMASNISTLRDRFLTRSNELIGKSGTIGKTDTASRIPELSDKTNAILARKKLDLKKQKIQAVYNNAYDMAVRRGQDTESATEFARQMAEQTQAQEFASAEAVKSRESKIRMSDLADKYGVQRINLDEQYKNNTDLGPLLLGAILGTGTNVALNRYFNSTPSGSSVKSNNLKYKTYEDGAFYD